MKFTPLRFQGSLAAGGVALMPFVFMQFSLPHEKGLIRLSDINFASITTANNFFLLSLIGVMLLFTIIHFILTAFFLKDLTHWLSDKKDAKDFLNTPLVNIGIFSPIISISMSLNVLFGPISFFWPALADNLQSMMLPAILFWSIIWLVLIILEIKTVNTLVTRPIEVEKLNFSFLLDSFAFGMVSLAGSGIAVLSKNILIASAAAMMTLVIFFIGFLFFIAKFIILIQDQLKASRLPENSHLLLMLVVIPIVCLYGISFYKIGTYIKNAFLYNLEISSYLVIVFALVFSVIYFIFSLYLLKNYFLREFIKEGFYPSQWGIVCALVGVEVLGMYTYGNYYSMPLIYIGSYASIFIASLLYLLILIRYLRSERVKKRIDKLQGG